MTRITNVWWLPALLVLAGGTPATFAAAAPEAKHAYVLPWGIVDGGGRHGYVLNPSGGIDTLDLENGKLLWKTEKPLRPLALVGKRLVTQATEKGKANAVRVVVLDVMAKGKELLRSDPVTFPDWVAVGLTYGRSFTSSAWVDGDSLLLRWQARAWYAGGARPTPEIERRARKNADGVARIDLKTGRVATLDPAKAPAAPAVKPPTGVETIVVEPDGARQKLVVKRKGGAPWVLLEGRALMFHLAADGRTLLAHQALVKSALPEGDYAWWVFSLETGKQVAKFAYEEGTVSATAVGPRAYVVVQRAARGPRFGMTALRILKAVELKSGKILWEHPTEGFRMLPPLP